MTRFARSDGSKGSNKREEEEATPWSVLVQQVKNATAGGVEDEDDGYGEMEEEEGDRSGDKTPSKADELLLSESEDEEDGQDLDTSLLDQSDDDEQVEKKNLKRPLISQDLVSSDQPKKKKRKKSEKCKVCGEKGHWKKDCEKLPAERRQELNELLQMKVDRKGKGTGRKKNKNKLAQILADNPEDGEEENTENGRKLSQSDNSKKNKNRNRAQAQGRGQGNKEVKDRSGAVIEEGEALFQGFRVTKEDQLRLKKLHKKLRSSGATKQEIDEALKRERRRAEKSLARNKKLVCFNCRQPGHVLADCPNTENIKVEDMPTAAGHCFKCGSLEHSSKDCKSKLKRENAYRFAVCFICKQEGHLAKACPDNPKGLYPNGGGCVFCGSVEHLKRDCPRKVEKDVKQGVRVGMMDSQSLEDEPQLGGNIFSKKIKKVKTGKVVAF